MDSLHWPVLTVNWRSILGAMFGFMGAALGTAGGIGGGTIFVPMLNLFLEFDPKSSVAISKCMILGASISTVAYNLFKRHPRRDAPLIDYDLALLLMPMLLLGISIGVKLNVVFPGWLITAILVIVALGTGSRVLYKAVNAWRQESNEKEEQSGDPNSPLNNESPLKLLDNKAPSKIIDNEAPSKLLDNKAPSKIIDNEAPARLLDNKAPSKIIDNEAPSKLLNILWKNLSWTMATMTLVWMVLLILQIIQIHSQTCSTKYWVLNSLQVPVAAITFLLAAIKFYNVIGNEKRHDALKLILTTAIGSTMGGIVAGLIGLGGGFITGPILLEFGVHPQVCSATATFIMLFSSSLAVVEYYFLHRFPLPYASFLFIVAIVGGVVGQHFMHRLVKFLGRPSIIVFLLCFLTLLSALLLGGLGIQRTIYSWKAGDFMGLSKLC